MNKWIPFLLVVAFCTAISVPDKAVAGGSASGALKGAAIGALLGVIIGSMVKSDSPKNEQSDNKLYPENDEKSFSSRNDFDKNNINIHSLAQIQYTLLF